MLSIEAASLFTLTAVLLALTPGPDNLFVLMQSARYGAKAGIAVTCGLCSGLVVHTTAVVVGVAALLQSSATAFMVLKIVGALYLVYLAFQAFRAGRSEVNSDTLPQKSMAQLYKTGILMNVTNPKVTLFFLAFLPQFTNPAAGNVSYQIVQLGVIFMVSAWCVFALMSFLAGRLAAVIKRNPRIEQYLNRLAGVVFVGLATKLVLTEK